MISPGKEPQLWPNKQRGSLRTDWLDAKLTLNFGPWKLDGRERFGPLLVLNDDRVRPLAGFGMHEHRDLDILMVPLTTPIEHRDSEGRRQLVRPGQIQWMRAGSGIAHSQMNASSQQMDRHLQLWVEPKRQGLHPEVHVHDLGVATPGHWLALCGEDVGMFQPDADLRILLGISGPAGVLTLGTAGARLLQVVTGTVQVWGVGGLRMTLVEGDTIAFHNQACPLLIQAPINCMMLCVDLSARSA